MSHNNSSHSDLLAILPGFLASRSAREAIAADSEPPAMEELFDLVEGRLSATQREDLLERIAVHPEAQEALADLLAGIHLEEAAATPEAAPEAVRAGAWERIKSWLAPSVLVPVASICLLILVALPILQKGIAPFEPPARVDVRSIDNLFPEEPTPTPSETASPTVASATGEIQAATGTEP